jgi:hypothetical protein
MGTSVTMETVSADLENIMVALQSNRSLSRHQWGGIFADIGETTRTSFRSLGNLRTLRMTVYRCAVSMQVLADALSETNVVSSF